MSELRPRATSALAEESRPRNFSSSSSAMRRLLSAVRRFAVSSFCRISNAFCACARPASAFATVMPWFARLSISSLASSSTSFSPCCTILPSSIRKMIVAWPSTSERTTVSRCACSSAFSLTVICRSRGSTTSRLRFCAFSAPPPQPATSATGRNRANGSDLMGVLRRGTGTALRGPDRSEAPAARGVGPRGRAGVGCARSRSRRSLA